jgi:hypothetical protein
MKALVVFLAVALTTITASASGLTCQLLKVKEGHVLAESSVVEVEGEVNITVGTFIESDKVEANITGIEADHLQLSITELISGISSVTLFSQYNSVNLTVAGTRYTLICLPN